MSAQRLRVDARTCPIGTDNREPEFSWISGSTGLPIACQVQVSTDPACVADFLWDTGRIASPASNFVSYSGTPLQSNRRYYWRVGLWTNGDTSPQWSETSWFETGLLDQDQWQGHWVGRAGNDRSQNDSALYLRGAFDLPADVRRARIFCSALGWYRLIVNGLDLTGTTLVPRWTPFDHIIEYQAYDGTSALRAGANVIAMVVADGRFRGRTGIADRRGVYGDRLGAIAQIEIELVDGSVRTIVSDDGWLAGSGRIIRSDPKRGEHADYTISDEIWLDQNSVPENFTPVAKLPSAARQLVAEEVERVGEIARLPCRRTWRAPSGRQLVDFGQNFAGVVRIKLHAPRGSKISLTFSEVIGRDGELDNDYLTLSKFKKHPPQRDVFITDGTDRWYQPWFTIHGFRYVEIEGLVHDLDEAEIEGIVISTQIEETGSFNCSDQRLNNLYQNVRWGMRSNFVDTPTDCPTRERAGWTGDIQVFSGTATLLGDVQAYLGRYLRNLSIEQFPDGSIPPYIPSDGSGATEPMPHSMRLTSTSVGWGDASILIPATLYREYADHRILDRQYDTMKRWMGMLESLAARRPGCGRPWSRRLGGLERYVIDSGFHWGEWLRPGESLSRTYLKHLIHCPAVVATAYFANSAQTISEIAAILDRTSDARHYAELATKIGQAWRAAFVRRDGARIGEDRQDDYVRALAFDLLLEHQRSAALDRLVELIERSGWHLDTGFLSTAMLLPTLARFGRSDVAYLLLLQETSPSWLHQVNLGATTTWESWEGYDVKGNARNSHNHYAFGAVAAWFVTGIAGISAAEPGYRRIRFDPKIGGGLDHASASIETPFGTVSSAWRMIDGQVELQIDVPNGASGEIHLPTGEVELVEPGRHTRQWPKPQDNHGLS